MKIFTTKGRRVKRTESKYERFITIQIELGMSPKDARNDWKLLNISIKQKSLQFIESLNH
jgi:hypothetical protein